VMAEASSSTGEPRGLFCLEDWQRSRGVRILLVTALPWHWHPSLSPPTPTSPRSDHLPATKLELSRADLLVRLSDYRSSSPAVANLVCRPEPSVVPGADCLNGL
jgi:hypothetical protein